jgi:hypothetical protein
LFADRIPSVKCGRLRDFHGSTDEAVTGLGVGSRRFNSAGAFQNGQARDGKRARVVLLAADGRSGVQITVGSGGTRDTTWNEVP